MFANLLNPISDSGADGQCLKIISLSYEHLPASLKPCFLYLGIFKEDAFIDATTQLLRFWIAQGFVKGQKGVCLEEVAEDYLEDLIDRNLILLRKRKWNGKVKYFKIHDIVRELCLKVAQQEKFLGVLDNSKVIGPCRERRLVVPRELSLLQPHAVGALELPSLLRSVICQQGAQWFIDDLSVDLKLLRLSAYVNFDFLPKDSSDFPTPNFQQVNLRYLAFNDHSGGLPYPYPIASTMSLFWNIRTLILDNDICVPYEIWEMTQLRHLEFFQPYLLPDPLPGVTNEQSDQQKCTVLENLHTLLGARNLRLTEEVCKRMPNVKKLSLSYNDLPDDCKASSSSYYCPHNLGLLNKLESLECAFGDDYKWRDIVLSLVLPTSLEELCLQNCHWEDLTEMIKSSPRLGSLELRQIRGAEWDLAEEEFSCLKTLKIYECDELIYWNANSSHFPVLEILSMRTAIELSEIPFDIGEIPTLQSIDLLYCSIFAAVSAMRIVVEQKSLGNENLLLEVEFGDDEQVHIFWTMVQEECLTTNSLRLSYHGTTIKVF